MEKSQENPWKRKLVFVGLFSILGLVFQQLPVSKMMGSSISFSFFNCLGLISTGFLGTGLGIAITFLLQFFHFIAGHAAFLPLVFFPRFLPTMAGATYFSKKDARVLAIPVIASLAFVAHPVGREVWYFSLFWTVPVICHFLREHSLLARSFGATFTAHAVGSVFWLFCFPLSAEQWKALIPLVMLERTLFALGMTGMVRAIDTCLDFLTRKVPNRWKAWV